MDENNLHKKLFNEPDPEYVSELTPRKLHRSKSDVVIAGVCSGIAEYFKIDIGTVRVSFILSLLLGNWPIVFYLIVAFLLPVDNSVMPQAFEEITRQRKENFKTVLSGIFMLLGLHFAFNELGLRNSSSILILPNGFMFPVLAIATGVFLLTNRILYLENNPLAPGKFLLVKKGKMISGVCSGLSKYLQVDLTSLRIIFIILSCLTLGLFSLTYISIVLLSSPNE